MALRKNLPLPSNTVASYHRVAGLFVLDGERTMEVHVESFVDENTRQNREFQPLARSVFRVTGEDFNSLFGSGVPDYPDKPALYTWLKTRPEFSGAVDV